MIGEYEQKGSEIGRLVDAKNKAYGDAFHRTEKILQELYPNGVPVEQYGNILPIVRILDKLFRIASLSSMESPDEEDPWMDIAGYAILMLGAEEKRKNY